MDNKDDKRRQLILGMLALKDGEILVNSIDHGLRPWKQLAVHLSPLIGESGFCALYARATRLVIPRFSWLHADPQAPTIDIAFTKLRENLSSIDPVKADDANAVLLDTFTELLSSLIGEALTMRVLDSAWSDELGQKNVQEQK